MELYLTKMNGEFVEQVSFTQIKDAFLEIFRAKSSGRGNYISINNVDEIHVEIYLQSVVVNDFSRYQYDGPGGPTEIYRGRYQEGAILSKLEEICNLLEGDDVDEMIKILESLPKPPEDKSKYL